MSERESKITVHEQHRFHKITVKCRREFIRNSNNNKELSHFAHGIRTSNI